MGKVIVYATMAIAALAGICGCGNMVEGEVKAAGPALLDVTVNTTVRNIGQYPESFVLTFANEIGDGQLDPSSFRLRGKAAYWGSDGSTRDFECSFESVEIDGNTIKLVPAGFPEKYFYVKEFTVNCDDHPEYGFTSDDITRTVTDVADDFVTLTNEKGIRFDYHLFAPEKEDKMPIVIVFHGFGDTVNLLTYRTAVDWAEPDNQKIRPCYVLAPVIDDETYFDPDARDKVYSALKDIVDDMIAKGKVDPDRIYMMGNSFGGVATIEYSEKYPGYVAAAIAMCPALTYVPTAMDGLEKIKDMPIWFAHATNDNTIPVSASREAVEALNATGAVEVKFSEYSDEHMNAMGADGSPDSTYSYHHAELAVMEDEEIKSWLFEHR
ncbi:MAG: dienelactone hydrolase family protein [Lachnospiraceae bacterium]|nr:dienelactone hydrolase family protein [Lachnospiraceae bacterium]